jgi:hypothetical protein
LIDWVLIGRLLRQGGPREQRKAEGRQDELGPERFHRCILRVRHRASQGNFPMLGSARDAKIGREVFTIWLWQSTN